MSKGPLTVITRRGDKTIFYGDWVTEPDLFRGVPVLVVQGDVRRAGDGSTRMKRTYPLDAIECWGWGS